MGSKEQGLVNGAFVFAVASVVMALLIGVYAKVTSRDGKRANHNML